MISEPAIDRKPDEGTPSSDPEKWVEMHGDALYRFALLRLRDPKLAEDAVQETLLSAFQGRNRFLGQASERSWLIGILKHKVIDYFRKISRETPIEDLSRFEDQMEGAFDENGHWKRDGTGPCEWNADPERLLERKQFWIALDRCLSKLPSRMAHVFSLREIDGVSSEQVCEVLNLTASNLWVLMHRARMQLRQCLEIHFFGKEKQVKE
ncbi:MAG: sigma-70 family RNA polymerase sigma factor [Candidatus Manganitrophus sp. SB1]|nr:sigma-70 family RNA polymerase sigma factor [Candidatus Manganitrophus morganii]